MTNLQDFTEEYTRMPDDELLAMWADRDTLVPEATIALERELQRRSLDKQDAARAKKRLDALAAREKNGPLANQVAVAKYERNMRHFDGSKEPSFYSPYSSRDIRGTFAYIRHKYRVWKTFHDRTGHWPVLSILFYFLSWIAVVGLGAAIVFWVEAREWGNGWKGVAMIASVLLLLGVRELGARLMRKLDWERCNRSISI